MNGLDLFSQTQVVGDYSDCKFDDLKTMFEVGMLPRAVKVRAGDVIDSIEFIYDRNDYPVGKSPFFHGGPNGYDNVFTIPTGDFLRKVDIEYGKYKYSLDPNQQKKDQIIRIRFTTNQGVQSPWYGNACGKGSSLPATSSTIDVGEDNIICCLYGATGLPNMTLHNYLQAVGFYMISFMEARNLRLLE